MEIYIDHFDHLFQLEYVKPPAHEVQTAHRKEYEYDNKKAPDSTFKYRRERDLLLCCLIFKSICSSLTSKPLEFEVFKFLVIKCFP